MLIPAPSLAQVLFFAEGYQFFAHFLILFGIKCMPLDAVEKFGAPFLLHDAISVMCTYLFHRRFTWIVALHQLEHYYYAFSWNKSKLARRVAFWISLDWFTMNGKSRVYEWCGVAYDLATHVFMLYAMKDYVGQNEWIFTSVVMAVMYFTVLSWPTNFLPLTSPSNAPEWIRKRAIAKEEIYINQK